MGVDPATGVRQRASFTHHGDADSAVLRQAELVTLYGVQTAQQPITEEPIMVRELLTAFLDAEHCWSAGTRRSHTGQVSMLSRDPLATSVVERLSPDIMEHTTQRWARAGLSAANIGGRFRVLHAAITWGVRHQLLVDDPLAGVTSPPRPAPRPHLPRGEVCDLLHTAAAQVCMARTAVAESPDDNRLQLTLFRAEQDELLVRLAANTGLTRGELAALHVTDLVDRTLLVRITSSDGVIGVAFEHRRIPIPVGAETAAYWEAHVARWSFAAQGPWLFSRTARRQDPLLPGGLGKRFRKLASAAGLSAAGLHRLRHGVGVHLVGRGDLLEASRRLRHRDVSFTHQQYGKALPTTDVEVVDRLARIHGLDVSESGASSPKRARI